MQISKIILYNEPTVPEIQIKRLEKFLKESFKIKIELRENFFQEHKLYEKIAKTKISDLKKPFTQNTPTEEDIIIEKQDRDILKIEDAVLYDGFELQKTITESMPNTELDVNILHVIFTNKLTCTFDESDFRYHARALIASNPTIISTTGIIEAPAKPKQYYLDIMTSLSDNKIEETNRKYKGEFLEYHDPRLSDIIEGYLLQAIIYYETGNAFCKDEKCRLYNAHWQQDLLRSQLEIKKLCKHHLEIVVEISKKQNQHNHEFV